MCGNTVKVIYSTNSTFLVVNDVVVGNIIDLGKDELLDILDVMGLIDLDIQWEMEGD